MQLARHAAAVVIVALAAAFSPQNTPPQDTWRAEVEAHRKKRDAYLRSDSHSPLALVHREYLGGRTTLTIGSGADVDLRLPGPRIAPHEATMEVTSAGLNLNGGGIGPSFKFQNLAGSASGWGFNMGKFNLLYRSNAPVRGAALEVYDTADPALREFRGLEFFEIDERYRVQAELMPRTEPPQVQLIDSAGQPRPYFIYGDLRFTLDGAPVTMEVYSTTLDRAAIARNGFMLIFADATSGKESYYAGRYLDIEGKLSGPLTVDFNLARNPPCAFSPVFTCPFPRAQNRLPVAIRSGEKSYRGKTATPLKK